MWQTCVNACNKLFLKFCLTFDERGTCSSKFGIKAFQTMWQKCLMICDTQFFNKELPPFNQFVSGVLSMNHAKGVKETIFGFS